MNSTLFLSFVSRFPSCGKFTPTRTSPVNNELKQQGDGAGETSRTNKLRVAGHGSGNTRARRTNTANRAPNIPCTMATCPYTFARFPSCGIFTPTRTMPVHNELKQQGDGAGEHLKNDKLRVAGHWVGNTRARRTNTAKRAPNMHMHSIHDSVHVCTISILWNFHTNPYQSSEQRVETTG